MPSSTRSFVRLCHLCPFFFQTFVCREARPLASATQCISCSAQSSTTRLSDCLTRLVCDTLGTAHWQPCGYAQLHREFFKKQYVHHLRSSIYTYMCGFYQYRMDTNPWWKREEVKKGIWGYAQVHAFRRQIQGEKSCVKIRVIKA